jgi:hypothetical protein
VWEIPKFVVWSIPKHLAVKPLVSRCAWCWKNRKGFGPWCKRQALEMPGRIVKFTKGCWKFGTKTLPRWIIKSLIWAFKVVTVRLPKAIGVLGRWILNGVTSISKLVWRAILRIVFLFSTVVEAVVTFFRNLTLRDIWNGLCDVFRAVFVAFPKLIWSWIAAFGKASYKMMQVLVGEIGEIIWHIGYEVGWVVLYLPGQIWKILQSVWGSLSKAAHEVKVWVNPKAS